MKNDWTPQDLAQMWTNRHHIQHIGTNKITENRTRSRGKVCHSRKIRPKRRREPRVICWRTAMTCHEEEADTSQAGKKKTNLPNSFGIRWRLNDKVTREQSVSETKPASSADSLNSLLAAQLPSRWNELRMSLHNMFRLIPRAALLKSVPDDCARARSYTTTDRLLAWR